MNCVLYIIPLSWKKENIIRKIYKNLKLDIDISVLQSASIKTIGEYNINTMKKYLHYILLLLIPHPLFQTFCTLRFTIHFATINTGDTFLISYYLQKFTIHFATINTMLENYWLIDKAKFTIQEIGST